jgi:hypothetical protein
MNTETKPLIELREGGRYYPDELGEICQAIYIVNRDAPNSSGGAMVSIYVQINQDSYGETRFGLLPTLQEVEVVWDILDHGIYFGTWGGEDTFVLMGHAVNIALDIARSFHKDNHNIFVINENGITESTICSMYSYMAERGFPF